MKIDPKLNALKQDYPNWKTVQEFVECPRLRHTLLKFLDDFTLYLPEVTELENVVLHGLRILGYAQDERVLPYIVEFLSHSQTAFEKDIVDMHSTRETYLTTHPHQEVPPVSNHHNSSDDMTPLGYSDDIIMACKQSLELLAKNKKFQETFWILYKVTLNKEVALEYLSAAVQCDLNLRCPPVLAERMNFQVRPRLQKALYRDFVSDPYVGSHLALLTLDTSFIPLLESSMVILMKDFPHNIEECDCDEILAFWGQIPITWFVLKQISIGQYRDIEDHINLLVFEDASENFLAYYQGRNPLQGHSYDVDHFKEALFKKRLKNELVMYFKNTAPSLLRPRKTLEPIYQDNIIPLFR